MFLLSSNHGTRQEIFRRLRLSKDVLRARQPSFARLSDVYHREMDSFVALLMGPRSIADRTSNGHGLGLAFVEAVARAHGGEVTAANREEGGAQLTIKLPLPPRRTVSPGEQRERVVFPR